eukprot:gene4535-5132_t
MASHQRVTPTPRGKRRPRSPGSQQPTIADLAVGKQNLLAKELDLRVSTMPKSNSSKGRGKKRWTWLQRNSLLKRMLKEEVVAEQLLANASYFDECEIGEFFPIFHFVTHHRKLEERDAIQKRVFTKWVNMHLKKMGEEIQDLFEDLKDGKQLLNLLELLTQEKLVREKGVLRYHHMQNAQNALNLLRQKKVKIVNIRSDDIVDGNPKLTLGLIWSIILHFQISAAKAMFNQEQLSPKQALIIWCKELADGYPGVRIENFTTSWKDGLAFNAVIHRHRPDLIDYTYVQAAQPPARLENAFSVAERDLGVHRLLEPDDILVAEVDEKAVLTYVSSLYKALPTIPPHVRMQNDLERKQMYFEYCTKAKKIITWIRHTLKNVNSREFPPNLTAMQDIAAQHRFLRIEVMPKKDHDRRSLGYILRDLQFLDLAEGLHPRVADELWAELLIAVEERTKALNIEITSCKDEPKIFKKQYIAGDVPCRGIHSVIAYLIVYEQLTMGMVFDPI